MIWSLTTKREMEMCGTNHVFRFYREALGKDKISLAIVDDADNLSFVSKDDTVLLRVESERLISVINNKRVRSTAEPYGKYTLVRDKEATRKYLERYGIRTPRQYFADEIKEGRRYFVKPRFGSDSKGITSDSICRSKKETAAQVSYIRSLLNQEAVIEEFIDGTDCTVACLSDNGKINTYAIGIECEETSGIQTRECKVGFKEYCSPVLGNDKPEIESIAKRVFEVLHLKHYARIDFRRSNGGIYYVIDVNLMPGLGPSDHLAKCLLLADNISYADAIRMVIDSAS